MTLFANKYRIEPARKPCWDYSSDGYYFITICTKNKEHIFGNIIDGIMLLTDCGKIVKKCWHDLPDHYPNLILDSFVIMPNHVHGIMIIDNDRVKNGNNRFIGNNGIDGNDDLYGNDDFGNSDIYGNDVETGLIPVSTNPITNPTTVQPNQPNQKFTYF